MGVTQSPLFYDDQPFRIVKDCDPTARAIANRHYSRQWRGKPHSKQFVGPGTPLILIGVDSNWLFVWRFAKYRKDQQSGVECSLFRNESPHLSSSLILLSEAAWDRIYGSTRKFTYVNPALLHPDTEKSYRSTLPGYCFLKAGWHYTGKVSSRNLIQMAKEVAP